MGQKKKQNTNQVIGPQNGSVAFFNTARHACVVRHPKFEEQSVSKKDREIKCESEIKRALSLPLFYSWETYPVAARWGSWRAGGGTVDLHNGSALSLHWLLHNRLLIPLLICGWRGQKDLMR